MTEQESGCAPTVSSLHSLLTRSPNQLLLLQEGTTPRAFPCACSGFADMKKWSSSSGPPPPVLQYPKKVAERTASETKLTMWQRGCRNIRDIRVGETSGTWWAMPAGTVYRLDTNTEVNARLSVYPRVRHRAAKIKQTNARSENTAWLHARTRTCGVLRPWPEKRSGVLVNY